MPAVTAAMTTTKIVMKTHEFTFTTPALEPRVFLHPEGKTFSIFEKGKPPVYFINDVNVSMLNIEFGKLPFEKFTEIRKICR